MGCENAVRHISVQTSNYNCRWYFGSISRVSAEGLLMNNEFNIEGSYLVRQSSTHKGKVISGSYLVMSQGYV